MEKLETAKLAHLARGPRHHRRDTRSDEDHSVGCPDWNIKPPMRPKTFRLALGSHGLFGFVLWREIRGVPGHAVLVRAAIDVGNLREIAMRRRRRGLPFQGRGVPGIIRSYFLPILDAPEQVDNERDL